jgi:ParB/RepB/Spo0J family partition protein
MSKEKEVGEVIHATPAGREMDIPLSLIVADQKFNARQIQGENWDKDIKAFSKSIDEEGQLQAVGVKARGDGKYQLLFGFRRFAAFETLLSEAKSEKAQARWETIRATLVETKSNLDDLYVNMAENVARSNLTPYDLAMRCKDLKEEYGQSGSAIASRLGKHVGYINNLLNVVGCGEKGDGVIEPILRRWKEECSYTADSTQTRICTTDWLNKVRRLDREGQELELNRELWVMNGNDPEKFDSENPSPNREPRAADPDLLKRSSKKQLIAALEACQQVVKEAKEKEMITRLNGVIEGLKFAIGRKTGETNRIRGVIAYKNGDMVEGPKPKNPKDKD